VPIAVLAGVLAFKVLEPGGDRAAPAPRPQATSAVDVPAPALAERPATVCRELSARLPDRFGDLARRPVSGGDAQNAAYGDPPVRIACGAAGPAVPVGAQYFAINGVCWYAAPEPDATVWSLQGREVPVVVTVPSRYTGEDLVDLAGPITATIPETTRVC
jgi:hypothetical protein